jgi:hypothetical protein
MLKKRFRARFRLPRLENLDIWGIMWNRITNEEADIADHVWLNLNEEDQEVLRDSLVISDLLCILTLSKDRRTWTRNPTLPMLKYAHMLKILQPLNWPLHFETIQNWIIDFNLHALSPKVTEEDFLNQSKALEDQAEKSRERWRSIQH